MIDVLRYMKLTGIIRETFQRFSLAMVSVVLLTALWLANAHDLTGLIDVETYGRFVIILVQAILWFAVARLWAESRALSFSKALLKYLLGFFVVAITTLLPADLTVSQGFFSFALLLALLFAPYFGRESSNDSIWYFNYRTGIAAFFATVTVVVFGAGISAVLASVAYLFEIKVASLVYEDVWILGWGFFWPLYVLYSLPRKFDFKKEEYVLPRGVAFIENYVLVPLMLVYTAVLYVYFAKTALEGSLPKGNLSYMISGFGIAGVCIWLIIYPVRESGTKLLGWFWRHFYKTLFLPVAVLFLSIGVRIYQYGMTEERYAVVLCALWLLISGLVFLFAKRREIKHVPMILALLCLLASFGPWSADRLSTSSQVKRLERLFTENGMLQQGYLAKATASPSVATQGDISSIMDYLIGRNKFKPIEKWFAPMAEELKIAGIHVDECFYWSDIPCSESTGRKFVEALGIDYIAAWQSEAHLGFEFTTPTNSLSDRMIRVSGYNFATEIYASFSTEDWVARRILSETEFSFTLDRKTGVFSVKDTSGRKVDFSLTGKANELRAQNATLITEEKRSTMIMEGEKDGLGVRVLISNLRGEIRNDQPWITSVQMLVLIKN